EGVSGSTLVSSDPSVADFDPANGKIAGIATGAATVSLFDPVTGCLIASRDITVTATTLIGPISGNVMVCAGSSTTLSDPIGGGIWSSSNTAIASVNSSASVRGVAAGSTVISYSRPGATCTLPFTVNSLPLPATGPTAVCPGDTITLTSHTGAVRFVGS